MSELQQCAFCKSWQHGRIQVPGGKMYCAMGCVETELFGIGRCRWCGDEIKKPYTSVESRLCSYDCSENYWAHVMGDRTAAIGTGKRYALWLQKNYPREYREFAKVSMTSGLCENPDCTRGDNGQSSSLTHLRTGARFCSELCRKQGSRAA
jgi:hypothetical protein